MTKGFGDGFGGIMQKAQEFQEKMQAIQEQIANLEVVGESGAGLVKVRMTARHDVRQISIEDSVMLENKEVLQDLVAAAMNDAVRRVEKVQQEKMASLTDGISMPPGFRFPFS